MKRLIHLTLIAALAAVVLPACAMADGGVLLSGYAPPGAGEETILGAAPSGAAAGSAARARSTMALAQPVAPAATRRAAPASVATRGRSAAPTTSRTPAGRAKARAREPRSAATSTASPAIVAAATGDAPGSDFGLWQGLLAAALASTTFVLGRAWLRRDK